MPQGLYDHISWRAALWWRRRWPSKALGVAAVAVSVAGAARLLDPARARLLHLAPRVAAVGRVEVHLHTSPAAPLSDATLARLNEALTLQGGGLPVHQRRPHLALVGSVTRVERSAQDGRRASLTLGVYQELAPALLRADTHLALTLAPPSLELLIEDLTTSSRGRAALSALRAVAREARSSLEGLRGALLGALRAQLPPDLWGRLSADERLRGALRAHFEEQVLRQIPWGALLDEAMSAPEFDRIRAAALEGVDARPLIGEALKGAAQHALRSRSVFRDLSLRRPIESVKQIAQKTNEKVDSSLNAGTQRAMDIALARVQENLRAQDELLKREGGALLAQSAERAQLSRLLLDLLSAITADEALTGHLRDQYGGALWEGLERGALDFLRSGEVRGLLEGVTGQLKSTLSAVGRALLFDHNEDQPGPNPLLLSVVEEQLRGEVSPVVHLTPGVGAPVGQGFDFQERPAPRRGVWEVLFEAMGEEGAE
jgi:hypothetical protein